jgi:hypothetical protein
MVFHGAFEASGKIIILNFKDFMIFKVGIIPLAGRPL